MSVVIRENPRIESGVERNARRSSGISEQLISFIEQAPIAIALFDRDMRYLAASQHWNTNSANLTGRSHYDVFPQIPAKWREVHKRVLAGEEVACDEDPVPGIDGGTDWVRWSMKPWRHPNGEVRGALLFKEVITAQIEAREKLAQREALFRETFENAAVGIAHVAPNGRWLLVNSQLCKITGYSVAELLTKTVKDITHPDDFEAHLPQVKSMYRGEIDSFDMEKRYIHKDGSIVWVRLRISCARKDSGTVDHFIAVIVDISQQKIAEISLRESEERFRGIFDRAGTGIAIADMDGRLRSCNPAFSAMLGYSEQELIGLPCVTLVHPDDREANLVEKRRLLAEEIPSFEIVNRAIGKGGKLLWLHKNVSLLRDGEGKPTHTIVLVTDITERKRQDDHIRLLMREMNHRSKNLLTVVQAIARQTATKRPTDFLARFGERVQALAASQDVLVKNEWKGASLDELIRSQLAHFGDLVGTRIELLGPSLFISASAAQAIGMALHELATNAGKYGALSNERGGIRIEWRPERLESGATNFVFGWHEHDGPAVCKPSKKGFGSTVITQIVELSLNATVILDFAETGLIWKLWCPFSEVTGMDQRPPPRGLGHKRDAFSVDKPRVLVVEDQAFTAMEIGHMLKFAGFDIVGPARGVADMLQLIIMRGCDAAVLHINLRGKTSEAVAVELTKRKIPFLTLSGYSREQYPTALKHVEALSKPPNQAALAAEISRCAQSER